MAHGEQRTNFAKDERRHPTSGLSENTLESYTLSARTFLEYCNRPAELLNEHDIRKFLWYLINEKKAMPGTVNCYSAAILFLFAVTFNRTLNYLQIPLRKSAKHFRKF